MTTLYKFKKFILFVVLYMGICVMTKKTLPEFTCDSNGKITLSDTNDVAKIKIFDQSNGHLCQPPSEVLSDGCHQKPKKPIHIVYGALVIQANNDAMVVGQTVKYFILSCEENITPASFIKNIKYDVTLSITGLSIGNVALLGDSFTLSLEGPDKHSLQPKECKAFPTGNAANDHTIWNLHNPAGGECFHQVSVIEQKWTAATKTKLNIEMYAFRFKTSSSVTIECSAYVCPSADKSTECTKKCIDGTVRRRRAIHGIQTSPMLNTTSTKIMVASTSFQVQLGDQNTGNSAACLSKNVKLYSVTSIFVLMLTMMIR